MEVLFAEEGQMFLAGGQFHGGYKDGSQQTQEDFQDRRDISWNYHVHRSKHSRSHRQTIYPINEVDKKNRALTRLRSKNKTSKA